MKRISADLQVVSSVQEKRLRLLGTIGSLSYTNVSRRVNPLHAKSWDSQFSMTQPAMNVFPNPVGSATRVFAKRAFLTMLY